MGASRFGYVDQIEASGVLVQRVIEADRIQPQPWRPACQIIPRVGETMDVDPVQMLLASWGPLTFIDLIRRIDRDVASAVGERRVQVVAEPDTAAVLPRRGVTGDKPEES